MSEVIVRAFRGRLTTFRHAGGGSSPEARRRRRRAKPTEAQKKAIYERNGYACVVCGSEDDLTVDHIIPVAKGGTKDPDNLRTLCAVCNHFRGDGWAF